MMNQTAYSTKAKKAIEGIKGRSLTTPTRCNLAVELASLMIQDAHHRATHSEKQEQTKLAKMMHDPKGKIFTTMMTDQCFRSSHNARIADQLVYLLDKMGVPKYLSWQIRINILAFKFLGKILPYLFVPLTKLMLRRQTQSVITPGENSALKKHLLKRRQENVRINLNHLGEAILGEDEALHRLDVYLEDLKKPEVEYISIKISTIYSQINLLSFEETLSILSERLQDLYRAAKSNLYKQKDGTLIPKFVNLDMEEYRDLDLTVELFIRVLDLPEFVDHSAGIVLQSYLPDSFLMQKKLTEWAKRRFERGGAPVKIRIVKGANLAMEKVEASLKCWPQAPYSKKIDVDANYKLMLQFGCLKENATAVHIGIGSHNLFDIAYGLILRAENNVEKEVGFEMLEGMADPIRRVVQDLSKDMLLYCPVAKKDEFQNAVAYLIRRLDENTGKENFLRYLFDLRPGSEAWNDQVSLFHQSCEKMDQIELGPRRLQNRFVESTTSILLDPFSNEPNTDWALPQNRIWAASIINVWQERTYTLLPIVIGGKEIRHEDASAAGIDPSRPGRDFYRYTLASNEDVDFALNSAQKAQLMWSSTDLLQKSAMTGKLATLIRNNRGELLGAMLADGGKTFIESDVEVSEAIDFAEYYRRTIFEIDRLQGIKYTPKGTILVAPPWNFPCSIPASGIIAALITGNCVIFKPAPESVLVGWILVNLFWQAGIPKDVLQFITCLDDPVGSHLISDQRLNGVILTGSTETAKLLLSLRPDLDLIAETGGKNAIIVTDMADRDLAIKDILTSAFGHSGQKCSAASLLICEAPVYDDPHFRKQLLDATASLKVDSAWNMDAKITPLIRPAGDSLLRALTSLDSGEEWLLKPQHDPINPHLWTPGIKLGVKDGSFMHQTELFGPILGVMRAENLEGAIKLANRTVYGLTSGIHSLDEREQQQWTSKIISGNCYINRGITGAIVQRQPFGGCKESSFGLGCKAGGPEYLLQFLRYEELGSSKEKSTLSEKAIELIKLFHDAPFTPEEEERFIDSLNSYAYWWEFYRRRKDPSKILGEDNFFYHVPRKRILLRVQQKNSLFDLFRCCAAALTCHVILEISLNPEAFNPLEKSIVHKLLSIDAGSIEVLFETDDAFLKRIDEKKKLRLRLLSPPSDELLKLISKHYFYCAWNPVLSCGRVELLYYLREVALSVSYHRYGNLQLREDEPRSIIN